MKTALITGATSGIGECFARTFAKRGYRLILIGRRVERLEDLQKELDVPVRIIEADLNEEAEVMKLITKLSKEHIEVFINNAGFGDCGYFEETNLEKECNMIHVNVIAMHMLFKEMLRKMERADRGIILNVASSAGLAPAGPYMATYYATKSYVVSLTRAVAKELRDQGSNVYVCALCPGPVNTEFNDVASVEFALKGISVEECVREAIRGMNRKETIIIPTVIMKLGCLGFRIAPTNIALKFIGIQQKKKFEQR